MSLPDNPDLFRTPRDFALHVTAGDLDADGISEQLSNLLGFAKNFYLQFFKFEFGVEIHALDRAARRAVRPAERKLRRAKDGAPTLRLVSQFVTLVKFLEEDEATEYDEYDMPDRRRQILENLSELLDRIARWSETQPSLPKVAKRARKVSDQFAAAIEWIDSELGYHEQQDGDD